MSLLDVLDRHQLVICVGSGGVGKTTTSAAIALRAARRGRRVLVLTIDPAKRLANSLGLQRFGNEETRVDLTALEPVGPHRAPVAGGGELWAMMLDNRRTFDDLIAHLSPDPTTRDAILHNRIYRAVADNIAGSQDYMATEKLYDVVTSGKYDLVVLDTPPVKNALDFLDAPGRLARFLDKRIMRWFLTPYDEGKVFGRLLMGTSAVVFRLLGYMFGREFLAELSEFFLHFRDLYDGFRERHEAVMGLFNGRGTAFLIVCAATDPSVEVAGFFLEELRRRGMPNPGLVVNQRHLTLGQALDPDVVFQGAVAELARDLPEHTDRRLSARLRVAHKRLRELSHIEAGRVVALARQLRADQQIWTVPRLQSEVHDIAALDAVGDHLFGRMAVSAGDAPG